MDAQLRRLERDTSPEGVRIWLAAAERAGLFTSGDPQDHPVYTLHTCDVCMIVIDSDLECDCDLRRDPKFDCPVRLPDGSSVPGWCFAPVHNRYDVRGKLIYY